MTNDDRETSSYESCSECGESSESRHSYSESARSDDARRTDETHSSKPPTTPVKIVRKQSKQKRQAFFSRVGSGLSSFFKKIGSALATFFSAVGDGIGEILFSGTKTGILVTNIVFTVLEFVGLLFMVSYPFAVKILYPSPEFNAYIGVCVTFAVITLLHIIYYVINSLTNGYSHCKRDRGVYCAAILPSYGGLAIICFCIGWYTNNMHDWLWVFFAFGLALFVMFTIFGASGANVDGDERVLSSFAIAAICLAALTFVGGWLYVKQTTNDGVENGFYYYIREDGTLNVCMHDYDDVEDLVIPDKLLDRPVRVFSKPAVLGGSTLKSVTMSDELVEIAEKSFYNCTRLSKVEMTDNVRYVGKKAFENCRSLNVLTFSQSVTHLSDNLFKNCEALPTFEMSDSVTSMGKNVFENCYSLISIKLSSSLKTVGKAAYKNCIRLTRVEFPASVETIGKNAFHGCANLNSFVFPEGSVWEVGLPRKTAFSWDSLQDDIRRILTYDSDELKKK